MDWATYEIHFLSLHDALPISRSSRSTRASARASHTFTRTLSPDERAIGSSRPARRRCSGSDEATRRVDRKSTRLNSSHRCISYAVFCLKKKKIMKKKHIIYDK